MNDKISQKNFPSEPHHIQEKSFQSFQSSATSLLVEGTIENEPNTTQISKMPNRSSNSYTNIEIENIITITEHSLNYFQELNQPGNKPIKFHLQKLYNLNRETNSLNKDYEELKRYICIFY